MNPEVDEISKKRMVHKASFTGAQRKVMSLIRSGVFHFYCGSLSLTIPSLPDGYFNKWTGASHVI